MSGDRLDRAYRDAEHARRTGIKNGHTLIGECLICTTCRVNVLAQVHSDRCPGEVVS